VTDIDDLEILDDDTDENYVRLRKTDADSLRKAARRSRELEKEVKGYQQKDLISTAGLGDLTDEQRTDLLKLVDDPTTESLKQKAVSLGWVEAPPEPEAPTDEEVDALEQVAGAGDGAGTAPKTTLTPADYGTWPVDKRMRFQQNHPDLAEALTRDQTINIPQGFN